MRNTLAPKHRIPRYHAFSTPEEQEAYIDATASSPAILTRMPDKTAPPSPTLTEISLLHQKMNPKPWRDIEPSPRSPPPSPPAQSTSSSQEQAQHDSIARLAAMLTLYELAVTCGDIEEADWDEYITPYEADDLEMLERVFPRGCWDAEIRAAWPNLVVLARWEKRMDEYVTA